MGLDEGAKAWMRAGGGHHSVISFNASEEQLRELTRLFGINFVDIEK